MAIGSVNPATGETLKTFKPLSKRKPMKKLELANEAFREHRKMPYHERAQMLLKAATMVERDAEHFGRIMTQEMGKTLKSAVAEAQKCALACRYYAEHGARHLADEIVHDRRITQLRAISAPRAGVGHHALEFPVLAGVSFCRTGADGRQRGDFEARLKCSAMRPGDRRDFL
jgi:acyl-CoA reductase-like NAD-dependent aldehyde dehydrogenase